MLFVLKRFSHKFERLHCKQIASNRLVSKRGVRAVLSSLGFGGRTHTRDDCSKKIA